MRFRNLSHKALSFAIDGVQYTCPVDGEVTPEIPDAKAFVAKSIGLPVEQVGGFEKVAIVATSNESPMRAPRPLVDEDGDPLADYDDSMLEEDEAAAEAEAARRAAIQAAHNVVAESVVQETVVDDGDGAEDLVELADAAGDGDENSLDLSPQEIAARSATPVAPTPPLSPVDRAEAALSRAERKVAERAAKEAAKAAAKAKP